MYGIRQCRFDHEAYENLKQTLHYKGIKTSAMVYGTIDLHAWVGFDLRSAVRVNVSALTDIQTILKRIFEDGIRIFHGISFFEQRRRIKMYLYEKTDELFNVQPKK